MPWSDDVSTDFHLVSIPTYPDGALIDVEYKCSKCGRTLLLEAIDIPPAGFGETEAESRSWGDSVFVECDCGENYNVVADNSINGWMVEFEEGEPPATFRYQIIRDYGESEEELPDYSSSISSTASGCHLHQQISDLIDTYTSLAEQDVELRHRYQFTIDILEETYRAAREQDEKMAQLEKTQKDFQIFREALENFKSLVDDRTEEPIYQKFLEKNPNILDPSVKTMYKKYPLGGELYPDFLLILHNNSHLFVEIEKPSKKIFNENGTMTADYRTAYKQISDYVHWARENTKFLKERKCPDINTKNIRGLLIIGHSDDFTKDHEKQLEKINHDLRGTYEIKTFDQILSDRKSNLETFGFKWEE